MADFKTINDFRKGTVLRKINEDPTYLSFFFVFDDVDKAESPLLAGPAQDYLEKVIRADIGKTYSQNLQNFKKVLFKINKELPWFWQTVSGLEGALKLNRMEEPWYGAEDNRLEIECLEENVELTAIGLMDLYKRATYDLARWVEIIPANLRRFRMQVWVSEVRKFQQDTEARNLGIGDNPDSKLNSSNSQGGSKKSINENFSLEAKPFIQLQFSHCEFDPDSIADMFADLSKNPELKKPKIAITYGNVEQLSQKLGANIEDAVVADDKFAGILTEDSTNYNPFDPNASPNALTAEGFNIPGKSTFGDVVKNRTLGKAQDAVEGAIDGATSRVDNTINSLTLQGNSEIGNVYGIPTGLAGNLLNQAEDAVLGKLLLGNVYGASGSLLDAVQAGSINAIANQVGQLFGTNNPGPSGGGGISENIYPPGVDSSPDGDISPQKVYDDIPPESNSPINDNAHE